MKLYGMHSMEAVKMAVLCNQRSLVDYCLSVVATAFIACEGTCPMVVLTPEIFGA